MANEEKREAAAMATVIVDLMVVNEIAKCMEELRGPVQALAQVHRRDLCPVAVKARMTPVLLACVELEETIIRASRAVDASPAVSVEDALSAIRRAGGAQS